MAPTPPKESAWRRRGRRILPWAIWLEIIGVVLFIVLLGIGERSRVTLIAVYLPRQPLLVAALLGLLLAGLAKKRILAGLQLVVLLLVLFPVMGLSLASSASTRAPLRFATYNVFWGKLGRPLLLDEIAAMPVDVLLVQAANGSLGETLRARFPDRHVHQEGEFVLLSRFPIVKVEDPPDLADGTAAMFMKYVLETPAGPLSVFNVHPFSPRHALFWDEQTAANIQHREDQIAAATTAARSGVPPFVIAGDTNLPPFSSIGRRHLGPMKDAFEEVGFGFGYTFPAKRPWMRIDRALGSDAIRFTDVRVGALGASDHRPLFFSLEITER